MNYTVIQQVHLLLLCFTRAHTFRTISIQPNINIRYAEKSDILAISNINLKTLPENYTPYFYESHLTRWPQLAYVAEDLNASDGSKKSHIVGYVLGQINSFWEHDEVLPEGHVCSLSVEPAYRGRGIGKLLMQRLHDAMVEEPDVRDIRLHVRVTNRPALKLYSEVLGYRAIAIVKSYYTDGEDAYLMRQELRKRSRVRESQLSDLLVVPFFAKAIRSQ